MHIVLSGYYGFHNAGDEAILYSIIQALKKEDPHIRITVLSHDPVHTTRTYGVEAANRWDMKQVMQLLKKADGLISGGGSLFQDSTGVQSVLYYGSIIQIAKFVKTPVFLYAQGMGPLHSPLSRFMVKAVLRKGTAITVRDQGSADLLKEMGVHTPAKIVPDPVFSFDLNPIKGKPPYLAVSVREWESHTPYYKKIAEGLDHMAQKGYSVLFVPMHGESDEKASQLVSEQMKQSNEILSANTSIEEKAAAISGAELLVGMRLHSLVFAAVSHVPFVSLSYDPKIDAFSSICRQPVAGHVEENDWNEETFIHDMEQTLISNHDTYIQVVETLKEDAVETARLALSSFTKEAD